MALILTTACGKTNEVTPVASNGNDIELESFDSQFLNFLESDQLSASSRGAIDQAKIDQIRQKLQTLKSGFQACRADLQRLNPQLAQQHPSNPEQLKAKLQSVKTFFQTNKSSLSPQCSALIDQAAAMRSKIQQRLGQIKPV